MSRSYKGVMPRNNRVYSVADVQELYGVCRNTVSNWVRTGLMPSETTGTQIFRGAELKRFHKDRRARNKKELRQGEFKCLSCKAVFMPEKESVRYLGTRQSVRLAFTKCPDCDCTVSKLLGDTEYNKIQSGHDTNTKPETKDEGDGGFPAGIGNISEIGARDFHIVNDRIILQWQIFAGKYDPKTVVEHLASIRDFEVFIKGKRFEKTRTRDAAAYRDHLSRLGKKPKEDGGLSRSTITHRASHMTAFYKWLKQQEGFRRLNGSIPEYFALPCRLSAQARQPEPKSYPSIEDALEMVEKMPSKTIVDRRDRAIVALAFVCGFRASALISLRVKHYDEQKKAVEQDGRAVRAKNGKSYTAFFFARTEPLQNLVSEWIGELTGNGFTDEDALFPASSVLTHPRRNQSDPEDIIEPMASSEAVTTAFRNASAGIGRNYTPHSARHCLKALGGKLCRNSKERKAWSLNLGHSSEVTTEIYYGKLTQTERSEVFTELGSERNLTDEETALFLSYYEHDLTKGSPEFDRTKAIVRAREGS